MIMQPPEDPIAAGEAERNRLLHGVTQAHEILLMLFGGVQHADPRSAVVALDRLAEVADRLECHDLVEWCRGAGKCNAEASLDALVSSLPQLLALWERAQDSVIARAFRDP